jgi:hypothetical protein
MKNLNVALNGSQRSIVICELSMRREKKAQENEKIKMKREANNEN